jgi:hypothetical protein
LIRNFPLRPILIKFQFSGHRHERHREPPEYTSSTLADIDARIKRLSALSQPHLPSANRAHVMKQAIGPERYEIEGETDAENNHVRCDVAGRCGGDAR